MIFRKIVERMSVSSDRRGSSTKNVAVSLSVSILTLILSFFSRTVFVRTLSTEYLGLSGLYNNILSFLALSELGIGSAFSFALYKPLKEGDTRRLCSLMAAFRRFYTAIGLIILTMGLLLTPFLSFFIREMPENIPGIRLYFVLNVFSASVSYFFSYKRTLIICDQKEYISTLLFGVFRVFAVALQMIVLLCTGSYFWYLIVMISCGLMENLTAARIADILYPFLLDRHPAPLEPEESARLKKNTGAIFLHKLGGTLVFSSDNIIISKFVGLIPIGLYSNYALIITSIEGILNKAFVSLTASIGNLMASSEPEHHRQVFSHVLFLNCWIYGVASVCLLCLLDPFLHAWLGADYLLDQSVTVFAVLSFYLTGVRKTVLIFKDAAGVFTQDRYKPFIEGVVNILVSVPLAIRFGIQGVIFGTVFSTLAVAFWFEALVFFRHSFHQGIGGYLLTQALFFILNLTLAGGCFLLCSAIDAGPLGTLLMRIPICLILPSALYLLIFRRSGDFAYFRELGSSLLAKHGMMIGSKRKS